MRQDNYHRIGSAHLQHYNQVKDVNEEVKVTEDEVKDSDPELRLPSLSGSDMGDDENQNQNQNSSARQKSIQGHWKSQSMPVSRSMSNRRSVSRVLSGLDLYFCEFSFAFLYEHHCYFYSPMIIKVMIRSIQFGFFILTYTSNLRHIIQLS